MAVVDDIKNALGSVPGSTVADKVVDTLGKAIGVDKWLGVGGGGNLGDAVQKAVVAAVKAILGDKDLLKELAKLLAQAAAKITDGAADGIGSVAKDLATAVGRLIDIVLEKLLDGLGDVLKAFPAVLRQGPLQTLTAGKELGAVLDALGLLQGVKDRADVVVNSVAQLFASAGGPGGTTILADGVAKTAALFKALVGGKDPGQAVAEFLKELVFPRKVFTDLLTQAAQGKLWGWAELPTGLMPGALNAWLNSKGTYILDGGEPKYLTLEREFRARLIAVADAYLRGKITEARGLPTPLARADERLSAGGLSDIVCLFLDTVVQFVFEPECFPQFDLDLDAFEDLGAEFAALLARQLRVTIRAAIGLLLRGVWAFSIGNEVLIELIAVAISVSFSAALEGVIRNLTWSLQITSRYKDDPFGGGNGVHRWDSLERAEWDERTGGGVTRKTMPLEYVALVRAAGTNAPAVQLGTVLRGLVEDFGAYLDVCYLQFRLSSRFPAVVADEVTISRAELAGDRLSVWATTTSRYELPRPVLRVYVCCHVRVMRPGRTQDDAYELVIDLPRLRQRCGQLIVLSNRGGRANRLIVRA